ncbi:hypothetical protein RB25_11620 [Herbaspirillum rubrisubalbicans]|uniref:hypothetical protein n=1 Tax=Herbaspirillum rubrisubalbicans TaxID=80842 RepID=UPI000DC25BDD|nr:hypothetical protein [Herbaspirillum rubrisubalbicans]RAN48427.1 hypothetical protein RB25_11620 [Herbaspirillum rubrisubalbicans]
MDLTLLWNNTAPAPQYRERTGNAVLADEASVANDLAWQQAMERAQQADLSDWFGVPQAPGARLPEASVEGGGGNQGAADAAMVVPAATQSAPAQITSFAPAWSIGQLIRPQPNEESSLSAPPPFFSIRATAAAQDEMTAGGTDAAAEAPLPVSFSLMSTQSLAGLRGPVTEWPAGQSAFMSAQSGADTMVNKAESSQGADSSGLVDALASHHGGSGARREVLRLYAEWSEQGVSIWLGADRNQPLPLAQLPQQLQQWLYARGERLASLTVNGQSVWREQISLSVSSDYLTHGRTASSNQITSLIYLPQQEPQ